MRLIASVNAIIPHDVRPLPHCSLYRVEFAVTGGDPGSAFYGTMQLMVSDEESLAKFRDALARGKSFLPDQRGLLPAAISMAELKANADALQPK